MAKHKLSYKGHVLCEGWYEGEHGYVTGVFHRHCLEIEGADYEVEPTPMLSETCDLCATKM